MIVGSRITCTEKPPVDGSRAHYDHDENSKVKNSCTKNLKPMHFLEFDFIVKKKNSADFIAIQEFTLDTYSELFVHSWTKI